MKADVIRAIPASFVFSVLCFGLARPQKSPCARLEKQEDAEPPRTRALAPMSARGGHPARLQYKSPRKKLRFIKKSVRRKIQSAIIYGGNFLKRTDHGKDHLYQALGMETYAETKAAPSKGREASG